MAELFFVIHQAVSSQARTLGLKPIAAVNDLVFGFIRCLAAAPLLPEDKIMEGVQEIWDEVDASGWSDEMVSLFNYFWREWRPRLPELSVYKHPERTNNCSESDNHSIGVVIPRNGPSIWQLLGMLY